jgi:hypothetical protein
MENIIENLFCSKVTLQNRQMVRNSPLKSFPQIGEQIQGHIFDKDGYYQSIWMEYDPDKLVVFICLNDKDKLICNGDDFAIFNTQGNIIDLCIEDDKEHLVCIAALGKYKSGKYKRMHNQDIELEDECEI